MAFLLQPKNAPQLDTAKHVNPDWDIEAAEENGHIRATFRRQEG